nr:hypothetical protein [Pseudomonadota bacterium]
MTSGDGVEGFHRGLVEHGLIIPSEVKGAYGRGTVFEEILRGFDALVMRNAEKDGAQELTFPPIL